MLFLNDLKLQMYAVFQTYLLVHVVEFTDVSEVDLERSQVRRLLSECLVHISAMLRRSRFYYSNYPKPSLVLERGLGVIL